jgi:hypothetical protein
MSVLLGLLIAVGTTASGFLDDPLPAPGTSYRGLPFSFIKVRPMLSETSTFWFSAAVRGEVSVRWGGLVLVLLFWSGLCFVALCLPLLFERERCYARDHKGLCINCGYNLTGNESGVCPECGTGVGRAVS